MKLRLAIIDFLGMGDVLKLVMWVKLGVVVAPVVVALVVLVGVPPVAGKVMEKVENVVSMVWPLFVKAVITQGFWNYNPDLYGSFPYHTGIDLGVPVGTLVRSVWPGQVVNVHQSGTGYGNSVWVEHGGGFMTVYGHLSEIGVEPGQKVGLGERLGLSGNSGHSTGPHLHFEIRLNGGFVDPTKYLEPQ